MLNNSREHYDYADMIVEIGHENVVAVVSSNCDMALEFRKKFGKHVDTLLWSQELQKFANKKGCEIRK